MGPATTNLPLILLGDFNSPANGSGATYNNLVAAGFKDAWSIGGNSQGLSCCQAPDLLNAQSTLATRIDLVLFRGDFGVNEVDIWGEEPNDGTPSGLWPSDHAGVAARLLLPHGVIASP